MSTLDPIQSLSIDNKDALFNPALMRALALSESCNPAKRSRVSLHSYLDTCSALNQKELVVLLRTFIGQAPASSVSLRKHILE
eukprot:10066898-Heterocapsa_arctica.AAC.1